MPDRIARWIVENDPSWEKIVDSNVGIITWTKKGTGIQAVTTPTSMFCDIIGDEGRDTRNVLTDPLRSARPKIAGADIASDITKYLSSRYINSRAGDPVVFHRKSKF